MPGWTVSAFAFALAATGASAAPLPAIRDGQLLVDGRPYLILGGELANSSSPSRAYMAERWPKLAALGLNTVLMRSAVSSAGAADITDQRSILENVAVTTHFVDPWTPGDK